MLEQEFKSNKMKVIENKSTILDPAMGICLVFDTIII